jgi:hypothetical protein
MILLLALIFFQHLPFRYIADPSATAPYLCPPATVGVPYKCTITLTGGTGAPYICCPQWRAFQDTGTPCNWCEKLPAGLHYEIANNLGKTYSDYRLGNQIIISGTVTSAPNPPTNLQLKIVQNFIPKIFSFPQLKFLRV